MHRNGRRRWAATVGGGTSTACRTALPEPQLAPFSRFRASATPVSLPSKDGTSLPSTSGFSVKTGYATPKKHMIQPVQ